MSNHISCQSITCEAGLSFPGCGKHISNGSSCCKIKAEDSKDKTDDLRDKYTRKNTYFAKLIITSSATWLVSSSATDIWS